ncbi:MAG: ribose-5-phosphate isomerase RpiA [Treponemataceae bacterium]|nr:MAG: ribose-5-phosphate isomerase RpiA [Treponemataceae bacterium]
MMSALSTSLLSGGEQKKLAAHFCVNHLFENGMIFSGMKIGLGTGSTAMPALEALSALLKSGKLADIAACATSFQTEIACQQLEIPLFSFNSPRIAGTLDATIDGADEIDENNFLVKGGGAALFREKLLAYNSKNYFIVADESKLVKTLAHRFALPVEIIADARSAVQAAVRALGAVSVTLREGVKKCGPVITDNGNMILDCLWDDASSPAFDPSALEKEINAICGVVENGFFTKKKLTAFVSHADGTVNSLGTTSMR